MNMKKTKRAKSLFSGYLQYPLLSVHAGFSALGRRAPGVGEAGMQARINLNLYHSRWQELATQGSQLA